jgi:hypothetical protein
VEEEEEVELPGNQLQAFDPILEIYSPSYACGSCGQPNSVQVRLLKTLRSKRIMHPAPGRVPQDCSKDCPTHELLASAVAHAVANRPRLKECFCPVHQKLDHRLAQVSDSPHAEYLRDFSCPCQSTLKGCWCRHCFCYRRQMVLYFHSPDKVGPELGFYEQLTPEQWLHVRPCEHKDLGDYD